jgi:hypothetical protein
MKQAQDFKIWITKNKLPLGLNIAKLMTEITWQQGLL